MEEQYTNFNITNPNVRAALFEGVPAKDSELYWGVGKGNYTVSLNGNTRSGTEETVYYVYVNSDVTISGTGKSETDIVGGYSYWDEDEQDWVWVEDENFKQTWQTNNINLALKAGWNALYQKVEYSDTFTGDINNPTSRTSIGIITLSLANPALRWVLHDCAINPGE